MDPTITSKHLITAALQQLASINDDANTETTSDHLNPISTSHLPRRYQTRPSNTLTSLSASSATPAKSALLTLHFLFPFDFLPALDLIDRQLIQKLQLPIPTPDPEPDSRSRNNNLSSATVPTKPPISTFYIQSASAVTTSTSTKSGGAGRFSNRNYTATRVHYEVRLDSWNCSCPAFAAASLRLILGGGDSSAGVDTVAGLARSGLANLGSRDNEVDVEQREEEVGNGMLIGGVATRDNALVPVCKHILAASLCDAAPALFGGGIKVREVSVGEMAAWTTGWGEM